MKQTETYKLNQWEMSDRIQMADFNSDNGKTEQALAELAGQVAGKAEQSVLAAETAVRESADNAERAAREAADSAEATTRQSADTTEKAAREAAVAALNGALALKGNCTVWTTSYNGTGGSGAGNPTSVTFPAVPLVAMVFTRAGFGFFTAQASASMVSNIPIYLPHFWEGTTLSWYGSEAGIQLNTANQTYTVVALLAADA